MKPDKTEKQNGQQQQIIWAYPALTLKCSDITKFIATKRLTKSLPVESFQSFLRIDSHSFFVLVTFKDREGPP